MRLTDKGDKSLAIFDTHWGNVAKLGQPCLQDASASAKLLIHLTDSLILAAVTGIVWLSMMLICRSTSVGLPCRVAALQSAMQRGLLTF